MGTCRYKSDDFYGVNSGIKFRFELHDMDYAGSETIVEVDNGGVTIDWSGDKNIFSAVRASSCTVAFEIANSTIENQIIDLMAKQEKKLYILIYKENVIYWGGPINTEGVSIEQNSNPPYVRFQAMDWIGGLQNVPFTATSWDHLTAGYNRLTDFLTEFFLLAYPSGSTFYMPTGKLFSTATPIYNTAFADTLDAWYNTQANTAAFVDDKGDYTLTYHQVFENILTIMNSKVIYCDGIYRVIDNRLYEWSDNWKEFFYNASGAATSNLSYDNSVVYEGNNYAWAVDPLLEFDTALKKGMITFRNPTSLRTNPDEGYFTYELNPSHITERFEKGALIGWLDFLVHPLVPNTGDLLNITASISIQNQELLAKAQWVYIVLEITDSAANTSRYVNNYLNPKGVDYRGVPDPPAWRTPTNDEYLIFPFSGGAVSKVNLKVPFPYADNEITRLEVILGGDYIYKTANTINGNTVLRNIDAKNLKVDMKVQGSGIVAGTYISSIFTTYNSFGQPIYTVTLSTAPTATASNVALEFWDATNIFISGDEDGATLQIDVDYLPEGTTSDNEGVKYESTNANQANIFYEAPDTLIADVAGQSTNNRALKVYNGLSWGNSTDSWRYKDIYITGDTEKYLLQKLTDSFVELRNKPLKIYSGDLFVKQYYSPHNGLQFSLNGTNYFLVFNGGTYTLDDDRWSGSWWMIERVTGSTSGGTTNTGTKISTKDTTKDIYPYVDFPRLDDIIKVVDDVLGGIGGALSMVKAAVQENNDLTSQYMATSPQAIFQASGTTVTVTSKDNDVVITNENGKFWKIVDGAAQEQFQVLKVSPQAANRVYAGPTSGASANPTFRALVAADLPSGVVLSVGTIDSVSPKVANGAQISGSALIMQTADGTYPGLISTAAQTIVGVKTMRAEPGTTSNTNYITWETNRNASGGAGIVGGYYLRGGTNDTAIFGVNSNATYLSLVKGSTSYAVYDFGNGLFINKGFSGSTPPSVASITRMANPGAFEFLAASSAITSLQQVTTTPVAYCNSALSGGGVQGDLIISARGVAGKQIGFAVPGAASVTLAVAVKITPSGLDITDAYDIVIGSTTGTKIGQSGSKIGIYGVTPIVRPTTAIGSATLASPGAGSNIKSDDTFDGYTLQQVVKALRDLGILT